MSAKQIRNTAKTLLLLYLGYFSCVSYFVHTHVFEGVVYVHSHPYKKLPKTSSEDDNKLPPFEAHHHTSAGFFTFNQLSNLISFEAADHNKIPEATISQVIIHKELLQQEVIQPILNYYRDRAPPIKNQLSLKNIC